MKIAHTADWHLGKRLENKTRLAEQEAALDELDELCKSENVDIIVVSGDVFDTSVPSAEAEELFYRSLVKLSASRPIVILAGNHDDADRLAAPKELAKALNAYIVGGLDNGEISTSSMQGGFGWLKFTSKSGEKLNLATLPFPSKSRMDKQFDCAVQDYPQFVGELVKKCCKCFTDGEVNVFASHLFMDDCLLSDERPGNAVLLTKEVLPQADYCALGHIHKPQCVSKSKNAYYSGSLLKYHFDENDDKEFIIYDSADKSVRHCPIKSGKKLVRLQAMNFAQADELLQNVEDCYAELIYESSTPLKPSEAEKLRSHDCLVKLTVINKAVKREVLRRRQQTDEELFVSYYKAVRGEEPGEETIKLFLEALE